MAGVPINDGNEVRAPRYLDLRYGKIVDNKSVPYDTRDEALLAIIPTRRAEGLCVYIRNGQAIEDWQFIGGILDVNLVRKATVADVYEIEVFAGSDDAIAAGIFVGDTTIENSQFAGRKLNIIRGSLPLPGIPTSDGTAYYSKPLVSVTLTLTSSISDGEYFKITTYTPLNPDT